MRNPSNMQNLFLNGNEPRNEIYNSVRKNPHALNFIAEVTVSFILSRTLHT